MSLLTGSANAIKYALLGLNFVFLVTGVILIIVGVAVKAVFNDYELFLVQNFFSIPTFLIWIGVLIFLISFVGCWGAIKENYLFIVIFAALLGIIFILELAAGISGYALRGDAENLIETSLKNSITNYNKDGYESTTALWDLIQRDYRCCGIKTYKDWEVQSKTYLPISCCSIPNGVIEPFTCTPYETDKNRFDAGCLSGFSDFIMSHAVSLGAAGIIICVIQFIGVLFAVYIAREVKIRNGITGLF